MNGRYSVWNHGHHPSGSRSILLAAVLLMGFATGCLRPGELLAQGPPPERWNRDREFLAVNALLGAVTGTTANLLRGEPPFRGLFWGAAGGSLGFAGKWIAVEPGWGRGLAGRQVALLGSSLVANTIAGRGAFSRVAVGMGPVRYYFGSEVRAGEEWRIDLLGAGATAVVLLSTRGAGVEFSESLSRGALVIGGADLGAFAAPGMIHAARDPYLLAHESVHVLQYDQAYLYWGDALEDWLWRVFEISTPRRVEFGAPALFVALWLDGRHRHEDLPWEREAMHLAAPRRLDR